MRILLVGLYEDVTTALHAAISEAVHHGVEVTTVRNVVETQAAVRRNDVVVIVFLNYPALFVDLAQRLVPNLTMPGSALDRIIFTESAHTLPEVIERVPATDTAAIVRRVTETSERCRPNRSTFAPATNEQKG